MSLTSCIAIIVLFAYQIYAKDYNESDNKDRDQLSASVSQHSSSTYDLTKPDQSIDDEQLNTAREKARAELGGYPVESVPAVPLTPLEKFQASSQQYGPDSEWRKQQGPDYKPVLPELPKHEPIVENNSRIFLAVVITLSISIFFYILLKNVLRRISTKSHEEKSFSKQQEATFSSNRDEDNETRYGEDQENSKESIQEDDAYERLGVNRSAPNDEIKKAYFNLINQYHPDKVEHLGPELKKIAEEMSRQINAAFSAIRKDRHF